MNNYKIKIILSVFAIIAFLTAFFIEPSAMSMGVSNGLRICVSTVIPSLFPFIVLSDFLIRSGVCRISEKAFSSVMKKLFRLPGCTACVVLMSLIGGFPVGASMTAKLVENNEITKKQGRRMLLFCVNGGPAFIISAVGVTMLSSRRAGLILYTSLVLSSLIIGFISRFFDEDEKIFLKNEKISFDLDSAIDSVTNGAVTMINICAWILIFSCLTAYLLLLPVGEQTENWINMICEVTTGCITAAGKYPTCVLALVTGWSGLAVHFQILPYIKKTGLKIIRFWLFRIINGGIACIIAFLLFKVFPCEINVFAQSSQIFAKPYSVSVSAAIGLFILCGFALIDSDLARKKKI